MPESCELCDFLTDDAKCAVMGFDRLSDDMFDEWGLILSDKKDAHCPVGDVPTPHGRLIDADELKIQIHVMNWGAKHYPDKFMDEVVHAPTIIESEE